MKRLLKRVLPLALSLAMVLSLASCGNKTGGAGSSQPNNAGSQQAGNSGEDVTIRITWWGGQARHEYTQKILDKYTELNPNVKFEAVPSGWDGYFEKLATDTTTGGMPDIVQMDYLYIATYAKNGSLHDLNEYIDNGTENAARL